MTANHRALHEALAELARAPRLLVALDFDGTLAPEVDDPEAARALPEARDAVLRLRELAHTRVALVSGRALGSLIHVTGLPDDVLLVGSHGIEMRLDNPEADPGLDAAERARVATLREVLEQVAKRYDKVWVEAKPAGFALHTRLASADDASHAYAEARAAVATALGSVTERAGKNVLEFAVRSTTKGEAIELLRQYTASDRVLYVGDDVTDEDAFAALREGDLALKSGPGDTIAPFRVSGPPEVAEALAVLATLRAE